MASIIIHSPGLLTTVQDCGRYGYQRYGMPVSGAMDTWSFRVANILTGNSPCDAGLETTLTGPEIFFSSQGAIAITGADMSPCLNGNPVPLWKTILTKNGDLLNFSGLKNGCRSYIAFAGGIDLPVVMGSRSTYMRSKTGGMEGRMLREGDELPLGKIPEKIKIKFVPEEFRPVYRNDQVIRVIPGPEVHRFGFEAVKDFLTSGFTVSDQSDRMGYRLSGPAILPETGGVDIISAGVSPGTIQVTGNGQMIILMADRQTTGGYARIANVASADLPLVAQMKPGETVRFKEISIDEAQGILSRKQRIFDLLAG